jgi:hypothetical protein
MRNPGRKEARKKTKKTIRKAGKQKKDLTSYITKPPSLLFLGEKGAGGL